MHTPLVPFRGLAVEPTGTIKVDPQAAAASLHRPAAPALAQQPARPAGLPPPHPSATHLPPAAAGGMAYGSSSRGGSGDYRPLFGSDDAPGRMHHLPSGSESSIGVLDTSLELPGGPCARHSRLLTAAFGSPGSLPIGFYSYGEEPINYTR